MTQSPSQRSLSLGFLASATHTGSRLGARGAGDHEEERIWRNDQDYDFEVHIGVIGDAKVGKTSLIDYELYGHNGPPLSFDAPMDGIAFRSKMYAEDLPLHTTAERKWMTEQQLFETQKYVIKVIYWDTPGRRAYLEHTTRLCASVAAVVYVCDVTNRLTLEDVYTWMSEIEKYEPSLQHQRVSSMPSKLPAVTAAATATSPPLPRASTPPGKSTTPATTVPSVPLTGDPNNTTATATTGSVTGAPGHVRKKTLMSSMSAPNRNKRLPIGATANAAATTGRGSSGARDSPSDGLVSPASSPDLRHTIALASAPMTHGNGGTTVGTMISNGTTNEPTPHMTVGNLMASSSSSTTVTTASATTTTTATVPSSTTSVKPITIGDNNNANVNNNVDIKRSNDRQQQHHDDGKKDTAVAAAAAGVAVNDTHHRGHHHHHGTTPAPTVPTAAHAHGHGHHSHTHTHAHGRDSNDSDDKRMGDVMKVLIGNHDDGGDEATKRQVTTLSGHEFAHKHGMSFYQTSCRTGNGVENAFSAVRKLVCGHLARMPLDVIKKTPHHLRAGIRVGPRLMGHSSLLPLAPSILSPPVDCSETIDWL